MKLYANFPHISSLQRYGIATGAVFVENYNETLDTGTIILPQINTELNIEPYDICVIYEADETLAHPTYTEIRRMCIDTIKRTITCLDPLTYKYEITLFSETKGLEGILLPSIAITPLKSGTKRSVGYYLQQYLDEYSPKTDSDINTGARYNKYVFEDDNVLRRFNEIECPEFQWNEPTLREVITDLMMVDDCIPVVRGDVIDCIDISQVGSEITNNQKKGINYITTTHSSADYVSEIKVPIKNGIGEGQTTKICENITFRNFETYQITDENCKVETSYPIWKLKKVKMEWSEINRVRIHYTKNGEAQATDQFLQPLIELELYNDENNNTKYILEYGEWMSKDIYYGGASNQEVLPDPNYQNRCLYYKIGSKGIHNFSDKVKWKDAFLISTESSVLAQFLSQYNDWVTDAYIDTAQSVVEDLYPNDEIEVTEIELLASGSNVAATYKDCCFQVEYETLNEHTLFASKGNTPRNKRQIVDNQSQSYVNVERQGMLEYFKANRLGNKVSLINARYERSEFATESTLPALAEKVNGQIIFSKEIAYFDDHFNVNYYATENYVLRDYFTGIQAKRRSWRILSGDEALTRADVLKFYINSNMTTPDSNNNNEFKVPLYSSLEDYLEHFKYCVVIFNLSDGTKRPVLGSIQFNRNNAYIDYGTNAYLMEFEKQICGKSVLFTFKALDNAIIGKYVFSIDKNLGNDEKAMVQKNCSYVDNNGENVGGTIYFYEGPLNVGDYYSENWATVINKRSLLPAINTNTEISNLVARFPFHIKKDNREITQITIQIEWNEEANDFYRGKR